MNLAIEVLKIQIDNIQKGLDDNYYLVEQIPICIDLIDSCKKAINHLEKIV